VHFNLPLPCVHVFFNNLLIFSKKLESLTTALLYLEWW
jgi:hypothetical protein